MPLPSFEDVETFERLFLAPRAEGLKTEVQEIPLHQLDISWQLLNGGDAEGPLPLLHSITSSFFRVIGVRVAAKGRENNAWTQPMIAGQTGGRVALVRCSLTGDFLVRAMAEPGNVGYPASDGRNSRVLVGPTVQFSKANLEKHGTNVPLSGLLKSSNVIWEPAPEDGGRFYEKVNHYGLIIGDPTLVEVQLNALGEEVLNYAWVKLDVLIALRKCGLLNGHLHSALALLL